MKRFIPIFVLALLSGCVGDLAVDGDPSLDGAPTLADTLAIGQWEEAEPGCEDAIRDDLTLYRVDEQPLLGALVDDEGKVICVDALAVLVDELEAAGALAADPSPQPSHPGAPDTQQTRIAYSSMGSSEAPAEGGTRSDPTPTPTVYGDPTPTPVINPDWAPQPRPEMAERDPDERDPTPTPTMEQ